jgi:uncharacterized membrane protein YqgA involved in biofilm formation
MIKSILEIFGFIGGFLLGKKLQETIRILMTSLLGGYLATIGISLVSIKYMNGKADLTGGI